MLQKCPLCGNEKTENELFCDDCTRKIKDGYEVDISGSPQEKRLQKTLSAETPREEENAEAAAKISPVIIEGEKRRRKLKPALFLVMALIVIAASGFYFYKNIVLAGNLEHGDWDMAAKENTIDAYLSYIQKYLEGKHADDALENMKALKDSETNAWELLRFSDNTAELQDFTRQFPKSAYISLAKTRLDSLMWVASVNTNTAQSYSDYLSMSENESFNGDYAAMAQRRQDMLTQSYPLNTNDLDSLKLLVDGFYIALSNVDYNRLSHYLAPSVSRFFSSGGAKREVIVRNLLIAGAKSPAPTIKFTPDVNALVYEKDGSGNFICNVPLIKMMVDAAGASKSVPGYIAHIEANPDFAITKIYEDKPFIVAP